jgi:hypothetical protein
LGVSIIGKCAAIRYQANTIGSESEDMLTGDLWRYKIAACRWPHCGLGSFNAKSRRMTRTPDLCEPSAIGWQLNINMEKIDEARRS